MASDSSPDSPPPSQWPLSLEHLLKSSTGKELFLDYLRNEDVGLSDPMLFLFAVDGLHGGAEENVGDQVMVSTINRIYEGLIPSLTCLSQHVKESIQRTISAPTESIYDEAAEEVKDYLSQNLYPNFLKSEFYIAAINHEYGGVSALEPDSVLPEGGDCHQVPSGSKELLLPSKPGTSGSFSLRDLQTVHEEEVLSFKRTKPLELTEEVLLSDQWERAKKGTGNGLQNPYHAKYASYTPVSRQDSEIQSVSSGRSDDSIRPSRHHNRGGNGKLKKDELPPVPQHIPLPKRDGYKGVVPSPIAENNPLEFVRQLVEKLKVVAKMPAEERLPKLIFQLDCPSLPFLSSAVNKKVLETHLKKLGSAAGQAGRDHGRLQIDEPELDGQAILDQHCRRVWKDSTTPELTRSPRNEAIAVDSRKGRRGHSHSATAGPHPHPVATTALIKGKSMMTLDSGLGGDKEHRYKVRPPLPNPRWTNEQFIDCGTSDPGRSSIWDVGQTSTERPKFDAQPRRVPPIPSQPVPHRRHSPPNEETVSVIVYYECEQENPFLIKIPKGKLTLGVLKSKVPKKGHWKYLFKLVDAVDRTKFIHYELKRDEEILPMFHEECVIVILKSIHPPEMSNVV